ncbi:MAG: hypothetical protein PVI30_16120 [Myxococcales bacterium]
MRMVILVLVAVVVIWAIAISGRERGRDRPLAQAGDGEGGEALLPAPAEPVRRSSDEPGSQRAQEAPDRPSAAGEVGQTDPEPRPSPAAPGSTSEQDREVGSQQRVEMLTPSPDERLRAAGERGQGVLGAEFVEAQSAFAYEPRDGSWARPKERKVRTLLRQAGLGSQIGIVNCRTSVCRVLVVLEEGQDYQTLLDVPGLSSELDIDESTPYSLRAGQLAVYARRREGEPLE